MKTTLNKWTTINRRIRPDPQVSTGFRSQYFASRVEKGSTGQWGRAAAGRCRIEIQLSPRTYKIIKTVLRAAFRSRPRDGRTMVPDGATPAPRDAAAEPPSDPPPRPETFRRRNSSSSGENWFRFHLFYSDLDGRFVLHIRWKFVNLIGGLCKRFKVSYFYYSLDFH